MKFGLLKDIKTGEYRTIVTPAEVDAIVGDGHEVYVQRGAGIGAGFSDEQFFKLKNELGLSDSKLYKLAGNSIMVPVLVDILSRLKAVNEKYQIIKE